MSVVRRFYCDDETGEIITYLVDVETGEPCIEGGRPSTYIPPCNKSTPAPEKPTYLKNLPRACGYQGKAFETLKKDILAGSNKVSYQMLLIPTVFICPALLCVFLMLLEIYLHMCCHKKNKFLKDSVLYYRSPFHVVTSIFCGVCRESDSSCKIGQLQDQRRTRYDCLRGIVI